MNMKAQEARELANSIETGKNKSQYEEVIQLIEKHSLNGEFSADYGHILLSGVRERLVNDGYKLETHSANQRESNYTVIYW
jgi:hypothetical protein